MLFSFCFSLNLAKFWPLKTGIQTKCWVSSEFIFLVTLYNLSLVFVCNYILLHTVWSPSLFLFAASPQTHIPVEDDAVHVIKVVMCRSHFWIVNFYAVLSLNYLSLFSPLGLYFMLVTFGFFSPVFWVFFCYLIYFLCLGMYLAFPWHVVFLWLDSFLSLITALNSFISKVRLWT